jgi:putative Ca2+/H+ antiporter (TMEM165/GDT1 family)
MQHHTHTALFATVSGVVGGKAINAKLAIILYQVLQALLFILLHQLLLAMWL